MAPTALRLIVLFALVVQVPAVRGEPIEALSRPAAREVRSIWITRWDYKTAADVERAIRWSAGLGLNRVFFQVRGRADAFYRSSLEPWGEEIGGKDPGFDPLETAIAAARAVGIELHAWVNVMPGWKGAANPRDPTHVLYQHPEWFLVDRSGRRLLKNPADYTILNPCYPEVRAHITRVIEDIAARYAIDGIQLDYIRFVGLKPDGENDAPYDPRSLALFRKHSGTTPFDDPEAWGRWRGLAVDTLVFRIAEAVRRVRPGARLSVAAIQDYDRARKGLFQDVVKWQARGWIGEIYPMTYAEEESVFSYHAARAIARSPAGTVFPGIGVHLHHAASETAAQIAVTRSLGARGYALFAFAQLFPSPSHESRSDPASKRLRAALRAQVLALNTVKPAVETAGRAPAPGPGRAATTIQRADQRNLGPAEHSLE
jgi:uncharacterized lipoprotein YddW (UPF0748 family)